MIKARIFFLVGMLFISIYFIPAQSRGELENKTANNTVDTKGKQWAVFIAIDKYKDKEWGPLDYPVSDAEDIRDILLKYYNFNKTEIRELYNTKATAAAIRNLFIELREKTGPKDSVFVFHAGHGFKDKDIDKGAWIPFDAGGDKMVKSGWIAHDEIRTYLDKLPAKHVFLISDSCYSGDLLVAERGTPETIINYPTAYNNVSRQAMSSGASEKVDDVSEFASRLKSILLRTESAYITPDYLLSHIKEDQTARPLNTIPILAVIPRSSHELGGSFLFFRKNPKEFPPLPPPSPQQPSPQTPKAPVINKNLPLPANFVRIEGGTFTMGSPSNEPDRYNYGNEVQHRVTVSSFFMGKYQVTQTEYEAVMGTNPSHFKGSNLPVECVSWYDAIEYCNRLSQKENLTPTYIIDKGRSDINNTGDSDTARWLITWNQNANGYRLPTEAEWEYACRAGTTTPFNTGNNITTGNANYDGNYPYKKNAKGTYRQKTTPVGSFAPNPWGLYDMHGNVWEWCWDWYGSYASGSQTDPHGPVSGANRVKRGGGWNYSAEIVRSAYRGDDTPSHRYYSVGFRLVRQ